MREFDYETRWERLLEPDIVSLLTSIHEFRGKEALFMKAKQEALTQLVEVARIQSVDTSNRIEGIYTSDERLRKIVMDKTAPRTGNEQEIAGYRDALTTIHESYDFIPIKATSFLQLHRDLYKFAGAPIGGRYKIADNEIAEFDADGKKTIRFMPVPAWQTAESIDKLCEAYDEVLDKPNVDPLLILPMFILDFLCIHPFSDGNGRMSRLLTLLLLYKLGYHVGKYISIEKVIHDSKDSYYEALQESSRCWHEGNNDDLPFVRYTLGVVLAAYREFSERVDHFSNRNLSKRDIIREIIKETLGTITAAEITKRCPDISFRTIQRTLSDLQDSGEVIKLAGGRYTSYTWNREKES